MFSLDYKNAKSLLPVRPLNANKKTFGKVLIISGSEKMVGCCELAVKGALRCGAGLVTLAFPDCLYVPLTSRLTENTFLPLPSKNGKLSEKSIPLIFDELQRCDAVAFGSGVGIGEGVKSVLNELVLKSDKPLVIDADGLNVLSENVNILKKASADILITPHSAEMARLIKKDYDYVEKNREKVITEFSKEYNVNVLLKGHNTLISNTSASELCVNKTGNTALSKGGSGDLLTGMISGFIPALKGDLFKSACLAAFVHGLTAELLSEELSEYSVLPSDCAEKIGVVIKKIIEKA